MGQQQIGYWVYVGVHVALFVGFGIAVAILAGVAARKAPMPRHRLVPLWAAAAYFAGGFAFLGMLLAFPGSYERESFALRFFPAAFGAGAFLVVLGSGIAYSMPTAEQRRTTYLACGGVGLLNLSSYAAEAAVRDWWSVFFLLPYGAALAALLVFLHRREKRWRERGISPPDTP